VKHRILLVPDFFPWILGTWAKEICKWNSSRYDFYFMSSKSAIDNPEVFQELANHVDVVHILSPHCLSKLSQFLDLSKTVSSVHHVAEWSTNFDIAIKCKRIMVVSSEWRDYLVSRGVDGNTISLISNGVAPDKFCVLPSNIKKAAKKRFGIVENDFVIGTFAKRSSNKNDRKGIDTLLDVITGLKDVLPGVSVKLFVTGPGWDDLLSSRKELLGSVIYKPFLSQREICEAYNCLDLYLISSRIEGGPAPLIEAMACGIPVVTTAVGMARDIIEDRQNGIIIPKDDPRKAVSAIAELQRDKGLRSRLASNGYHTVTEKFKWEQTVGNISDLYGPVFKYDLKSCLQFLFKRIRDKKLQNPELQRENAVLEDNKYWADELKRDGHADHAAVVGDEPVDQLVH